MPKVNPIPPAVAAAADAAAIASGQRAELQLGYGRCGWLESDPAAGRVRLWHLAGEQPRPLTAPRYSPRSRVYEYGGGAWALAPEGAWFVNDADQGLYLQPWDGGPAQLWWRRSGCRYGDLTLDLRHRRLLAVEEQHLDDGAVVHRLVAISLQQPRRRVLAEGADFYAAPTPSPDGRQLAWISWDHPHQPWSATRLQRARLDSSGRVLRCDTLVDGCARRPEALQQPRYLPDGTLLVLSDRDGWWNLYRCQRNQLQSLCPLAAECGSAPWQLGARSYQPLDDERVLLSWLQQGVSRWGLLQIGTGALQALQALPGHWGELASVQVSGAQIAALASDGAVLGTLLCCTLESAAGAVSSGPVRTRVAGIGGARSVAAEHLRIGEAAGGEPLYAFYYPAPHANGGLLLQLHGGPTAYRAAVRDRQREFWLGLGIGVLELNYSGSSGYGRAYRERLYRRWGEREADDACVAGRYALDQGLAAPGQLWLRGNSAGGFTLLRALQRPDTPFSAAACHYGIGDLGRLAASTHKFERHYLDWLIGPVNEDPAFYRERSPQLNEVPIRTPVIFFQGTDDRVVPAEQTRRMHRALRAAGVASEYVELHGEGHGFRHAHSRAEVLKREWAFYQRYGNGGATESERGRRK